MNEYYSTFFKEWLFLSKINIQTALTLIEQKSDNEISNITGVSKPELKKLIKKCQILPEDKLSCEIRGGAKLTPADIEFYTTAVKYDNLKTISNIWQSSPHAVQTNVKIIIAKILLMLYPDFKGEII